MTLEQRKERPQNKEEEEEEEEEEAEIRRKVGQYDYDPVP